MAEHKAKRRAGRWRGGEEMENYFKGEGFGVRVCLCNFFIKDNESSIESENRGWKMMKGCRHIGETLGGRTPSFT